jgi:hypothetical protein
VRKGKKDFISSFPSVAVKKIEKAAMATRGSRLECCGAPHLQIATTPLVRSKRTADPR